jgi:hypothetical protein
MPPSHEAPFTGGRSLVGDLWALWKTDARWARILEIKRTGRFAQIRLEVHEADLPPWEHWTRTLIPFGRDPKVGDDVYWVDKTDAHSTFRQISIRWRREPNYGSPQPTAEELEQTYLTPYTSNRVFAAGQALANDPMRQLELLQQDRADGGLSEQEFQHKKEDLLAWFADPVAENDPAVHRRRPEERRAAGQVSDAEYAARSAELDAWKRGLAQVRAAQGRL